VAHRAGAIATKDLERVVVDTTVQEKAIAHPTDARLTHRAVDKAGRAVQTRRRRAAPELSAGRQACRHHGGALHPCPPVQARPRSSSSCARGLAASSVTSGRKIAGNTALEERFGPLPALALRVRHQEQRQRGPKVYSLHAPEVECMGKGKARKPYEFGCKVSTATSATAPKGGHFVLHAKALHGNPYDGHTLGPVITNLEMLTDVAVQRIHADKGYRGHKYPDPSRSGSAARSGASPRPFAARCGGAPPSNP